MVRLIQGPPPTLMLTVNPAPVGAVPTNATTSLGVRVAFNCNGGAWLLPIASVPPTCRVAPGEALVPTAPYTQSSRIGASPSGDSLPFTSTVKPAITNGCMMKFAVGMDRVTGVRGLGVIDAGGICLEAPGGVSIIQIVVSSIVSAGWNVSFVAVFAVMVLGGCPRPVFPMMRIRFPISTPTPATTPIPP
jgi:hypothetical protein